MDNKTPEEAFFRKKPDISHLRIFGCLVYVHVPKEKRTKLEPFGRKGILIGFSETVKGQRVYIPGQKQIELSRDVIFEEDIAFRRAKTFDALDTFDVSLEETPVPEIRREFLLG